MSTAPKPPLPPPAPVSHEVITAKAATYYRMTRYIMFAMLVGFGVWFAYDGYVGWPRDNERFAALSLQIDQANAAKDMTRVGELSTQRSELKQHTPTDIRLQKVLAFVMPVLGIGALCWALYNSRGAYRLAGDRLLTPGHPEVPLDRIVRIDRGLWDRKGIAYVYYDLGGAGEKRLKLDDFVYDRKPTDDIFERVERYVNAR
jgi:hypothetical protein